MADSCFIADFRVVHPTHSISHAASVRWLSEAHTEAESILRRGDGFDREAFLRLMEQHIRRFGCGPESLARRGHDLEDFLHQDWGRMRIFNLPKAPGGAGTWERMELFSEIADRAAEAFYPEGSEPPDDIIHVTCTG